MELCSFAQTEKEHIEYVIQVCEQIFNDAVGDAFFKHDNLKVAFVNSESSNAVYEAFCKKYFPKWLTVSYTRPEDETISAAQAFVNENVYGVMVRLDTGRAPDEWYMIILHEMSHIFCMVHEFDGEDFVDKYCQNRETDWVQRVIFIGYKVWSEFIASHIAVQINHFSRTYPMSYIREEIFNLDKEIEPENSYARWALSEILVCVFANTRIRKAKHVGEVFDVLERNRVFSKKKKRVQYFNIIKLIDEQLRKSNCIKIDVDFIESVGKAYLKLLAWRYADENNS